jgi:hypothetical protein
MREQTENKPLLDHFGDDGAFRMTSYTNNNFDSLSRIGKPDEHRSLLFAVVSCFAMA